MVDLKNDPAYNDDSQPSITNSTQALREADLQAGIPEREVLVQPPADVVDAQVRAARADVAVEDVVARVMPEGPGDDVGAASKEAAAEETGESQDETSGDYGSGPYESRTNEQLRALAHSRGLSASGTKEELVERLRQ
jgi:SAP domain